MSGEKRIAAFVCAAVMFSFVFCSLALLLWLAVHFIAWKPIEEAPWALIRLAGCAAAVTAFFYACSDEAVS